MLMVTKGVNFQVYIKNGYQLMAMWRKRFDISSFLKNPQDFELVPELAQNKKRFSHRTGVDLKLKLILLWKM